MVERAGVLCLVVAEQVQWIERQRVRVPLKSAASNRVVPVPPPWDAEIRGFLMMLGGDDDTPLFGEISPYQDDTRWRSMLREAGVPVISLHGARGTGASLMLARGVPERYIADLLGHSATKVTQEHYLHSDEAQRLGALVKMVGALEAPPAGAEVS